MTITRENENEVQLVHTMPLDGDGPNLTIADVEEAFGKAETEWHTLAEHCAEIQGWSPGQYRAEVHAVFVKDRHTTLLPVVTVQGMVRKYA